MKKAPRKALDSEIEMEMERALALYGKDYDFSRNLNGRKCSVGIDINPDIKASFVDRFVFTDEVFGMIGYISASFANFADKSLVRSLIHGVSSYIPKRNHSAPLADMASDSRLFLKAVNAWLVRLW